MRRAQTINDYLINYCFAPLL